MTSTTRKFRIRIVAATLAVVAVVAFQVAPLQPVAAEGSFEDRINRVQSQIDGYQQEIIRLREQGNTYQNAVSTLNAQKNTIQSQVDLSQAKYDKLQQDIKDNEAKLAEQQEVFIESIGDIAAASQESPIEILASADTVGDYVSRQDYRSSIQDQAQSSIKEIARIKAELSKQETAVKQVLADEKTQRDNLASKEAEQSRLLASTQGEESKYQQTVGTLNSQLAAIRAEQAAAMRSSSSAENVVYGSSSYPWMSSSMNYDDYCQYYSGGSAADPFGYCKRQCVSYVAWKLNTDDRHRNRGYSGLGNAIDWWSAGGYVPVNDIQTGDVIVWNISTYGHVMYVDSVSGDKVSISQMNVPYNSGSFSTATYTKDTLSGDNYTIRRFH